MLKPDPTSLLVRWEAKLPRPRCPRRATRCLLPCRDRDSSLWNQCNGRTRDRVPSMRPRRLDCESHHVAAAFTEATAQAFNDKGSLIAASPEVSSCFWAIAVHPTPSAIQPGAINPSTRGPACLCSQVKSQRFAKKTLRHWCGTASTASREPK